MADKQIVIDLTVKEQQALKALQVTERELKNLRDKIVQLDTGLEASGLSMGQLTNNLKKLNVGMVDTKRGAFFIDKVTGDYITLGKGIRMAQREQFRFRDEYLSILFFSQMMTRNLQRLGMTSVKTFMEIAGESNHTNQALATVNAQFTFMRFTLGRLIGEAIEPLLPSIIAFTQTIVDFVERHPEATILTLAGAFATFFVAGSVATFALFVTSVEKLAASLGSISGIKNLGALESLKRLGAGAVGFSLVYKGLFGEDGKPLAAIGDLFAGTALLQYLVKGKANLWVLSIGLALKFLGDPDFARDLGKWFAQLTGHLIEIGIWIAKTIWGAIKSFFTNQKSDPIPLPTSFGTFGEGFTEGVKEGSLYNSQWAKDMAQKDVPMASGALSNFEMNFQGIFGRLLNHTGLLGFMIGSPTKGSYPLVYALGLTDQAWNRTGGIAVSNIDKIINKINAIPREVVTVHRIVTVEEKRSSSRSSIISKTRT